MLAITTLTVGLGGLQKLIDPLCVSTLCKLLLQQKLANVVHLISCHIRLLKSPKLQLCNYSYSPPFRLMCFLIKNIFKIVQQILTSRCASKRKRVYAAVRKATFSAAAMPQKLRLSFSNLNECQSTLHN